MYILVHACCMVSVLQCHILSLYIYTNYVHAVRSLRPRVFQSASVRCFSQRQCPESEVTWCFNLYHPSKSIEVCWDSNNNVINMTGDAAALNITKFLAVTDVS